MIVSAATGDRRLDIIKYVKTITIDIPRNVKMLIPSPYKKEIAYKILRDNEAKHIELPLLLFTD
ncbi:hypothetical protein FH5_03140 [Priestia endophytica]|nr:hypothetical protein FH5_03140 [Priestia endophytica]